MKRYTPEQLIRYLKQAEVLSSYSRDVLEICGEIVVREKRYYHWHKEYGGMGADQTRWLDWTYIGDTNPQFRIPSFLGFGRYINSKAELDKKGAVQGNLY